MPPKTFKRQSAAQQVSRPKDKDEVVKDSLPHTD